MSTINERIKERRLAANLTLDQVAKHLGVKEATVQRYESGTIKNIKHETIIALANLFKCKPSYLMGWDDQNSSLPVNEILNSGIKNILPLEKKTLPILDSISCSEHLFVTGQHPFYGNAARDVPADFVLEAKGDSMIGARIFNGDLVFVKFQPDVDNGEIAAVIIDGEAVLKRVYKYSKQIVLQSENPAFEPIVIDDQDPKEIRIIGKAIFFMSEVK
jgi:repressor LexA